MAIYLFIFHSDGMPLGRVEQECNDDADALKTAIHLSRDYDVDLWHGSTVVAELSNIGSDKTLLRSA